MLPLLRPRPADFEIGDISKPATEVADPAKGKLKLGVEMPAEFRQRLKAIDTMERGTRPIVGPS